MSSLRSDESDSSLTTRVGVFSDNNINSISEDNCHLYLWVTNNYVEDGYRVLRAWGFRPITIITWLKDKIGLGQYYRGITEHCLFGVKGILPYKVLDGKRQQGRTGFEAPRTKHSMKPHEVRDMIEKVSYPSYVEIFARPDNNMDIFAKPLVEWDFIGNEVDGKDIRDF